MMAASGHCSLASDWLQPVMQRSAFGLTMRHMWRCHIWSKRACGGMCSTRGQLQLLLSPEKIVAKHFKQYGTDGPRAALR